MKGFIEVNMAQSVQITSFEAQKLNPLSLDPPDTRLT